VRIATSDPLRSLVELPVELVAQHLAARRPVQPPTTGKMPGDEKKGGG
jgi:hypothetical protein